MVAVATRPAPWVAGRQARARQATIERRPAARTMVLRSQADADRAANRPGFVTSTHNTETSTTMTNATATLDRPTVSLSCHHSITWAGQDDPQPGDKAACFKCPPNADNTPKQRTVKAVKGAKPAPAPAAAPEPAPQAPQPAEQDDVVAKAVTAILADLTDLVADQAETAEDGTVVFTNLFARQRAAKAAARRVRDNGGTPKQAGKASDAIMAMGIAAKPPADGEAPKAKRSSKPEGEVTGLKLSGPRTEALRIAAGGGIAHDPDEKDAMANLLDQMASDDAKRVSLSAPAVRAMLRNLPTVEADEKLAQGVRAAAGKAIAWLTKSAEAAGYAG